MRLKLVLCGVAVCTPALLITGCGVDQMSSVTPNVVSPAISGRSFGGQQPLTGATISVVAMGTSGYGSSGGVLASVVTDSNGNFSFPAGAYTCPQSDTQVYLLSIGGNPGLGTGNNGSAVLAAALGKCANAKQSFVIMNEVTTAATAFVLSHFFSPTLGGANAANDTFGGPSSTSGGLTVYSQGLVMGTEVTYPTIVSNSNGGANLGGNGITVEWQKINTIADILAECVNSGGSTSTTETHTTCGKIFNFTQNNSANRPTDTLQAAVQMALFPTTKVTQLYNLISGNAPFIPYMSSAPNDWTIGVSYTSSALGLAVNTGTTSTLDIDAAGRVWFPSNASGQVGAAYFDPSSQSFNGPFNSTGLVDPQQVAIDANGYAWYNDSASASVPGYLTSAPMTTQSLSLPGSVSSSVSVGGDNRVAVGILNSSTPELAYISANRTTYGAQPGVSFVFPVASVAGDFNDDDGVSISNPSTTQMRDYFILPGTTTTESEIDAANANGAQVIYTGNDDIAVRSYAGNAADGLCVFSLRKCSNLQGAPKNAAQGIAIDGGKQLWVASSGDSGIYQIPVNNPGATGGAVYLNSSGANNVPNNEFLHDANDSGTGTATAPAPYGIGIDATGNVWVTNAGCTTNSTSSPCTPGTFTLTEIVGAGYPTITPVSAQITSGVNLVGTEPTK